MTPAEYAHVSILAREVSEQMLTRLECMTLQPKRILDLSCRTGYHTTLLNKHYPTATIFAVDHEQAMLKYARQHFSNIAIWIQADAENLPFTDHSIDLIFANFILPWCEGKKALREWQRILRPEGLLILSSLGPDTLYPETVIPHLIDMHNLGDSVIQSGFADPVLDVENITLTYRECKQLLHELHVTEMLASNQSTISIEKNSDGLFSITYEIIYCHAWGTTFNINHTADETGTVKIPLTELRKHSYSKNK